MGWCGEVVVKTRRRYPKPSAETERIGCRGGQSRLCVPIQRVISNTLFGPWKYYDATSVMLASLLGAFT